MIKKITLTVFILLNVLNYIFADPSKGQWKQFVYTDGLSSNYIFDVEKDDNDRIWIGTQNGVTLIDGSNIRKYGADDGLPAANIVKVVSLNNTIYAATSSKGIYVLNNDSFEKSTIFALLLSSFATSAILEANCFCLSDAMILSLTCS